MRQVELRVAIFILFEFIKKVAVFDGVGGGGAGGVGSLCVFIPLVGGRIEGISFCGGTCW